MSIAVVGSKFKIEAPNNNKPEYIIIHHALAKHCTIDDIQRWHLDLGWSGIGYHYFISKDGYIFEGRKEEQRGGHCKQGDMNSRSIGICLEGCYEDYKKQTDKDVPAKQIKALFNLTKHLQRKYNIPVSNVKRHHDFAPYKLCPGNYFPWEEFVETLKGENILPDIYKHWAKNNIYKVVAAGIMEGFPDGEFKPNLTVTRAELATVVANLLDIL
ncbi:N-acetylmuramoyl-L-alanine amidase [Vallitalea guaymasensis]|mgnify:CR=1 FL=1|uniref:N-acetylmuramoyl-L-alanine amidase n=1 Tax=Vallitalea guaymasensis TaxID=1185412 RepID=UPI0023558BE0|nr:N-acetylmuramoyl-L-alanine amidase [Vallitalea guaymasensis]